MAGGQATRRDIKEHTMARKQTTPAVETTPADAAPVPTACRCGCGQPTVRPDARYVAGHDARHAGQVARDPGLDPEVVFADAPRLLAKAQAIRATADRKAAEKAARAAAREAAKVAYADALANA